MNKVKCEIPQNVLWTWKKNEVTKLLHWMDHVKIGLKTVVSHVQVSYCAAIGIPGFHPGVLVSTPGVGANVYLVSLSESAAALITLQTQKHQQKQKANLICRVNVHSKQLSNYSLCGSKRFPTNVYNVLLYSLWPNCLIVPVTLTADSAMRSHSSAFK